MLRRRHLLVLSASAGLPRVGRAEVDTPALYAAAQLLVGVERLAKLSLERGLLPTRAEQQLVAERQRVEAAARRLLDHPRQLQGLSERRQAQVAAAASDAVQFAAAPPGAAQQLLGESEALAVKLGFATTALSGIAAQPQLAAQIDLFARAAASSLRVGKFNLAAARSQAPAELSVSAHQALGEFSAALQAVGEQSLSAAQRGELQLARHQWLLFSAALGPNGLAKDTSRLAEIASTTDRMAESLGAMARRALV